MAQLPHGSLTSTLPNGASPVQNDAHFQALPIGMDFLYLILTKYLISNSSKDKDYLFQATAQDGQQAFIP